jgi:spore germination protein PE
MSIQCRNTSLVNLFVNTVSSTGNVHLGDHSGAALRSRVLAVARAITNYEENDFLFASYRIFFLPKKTLKPLVTVAFQSRSPLPNIQVGSVKSVGVSSASLLRVGCGGPHVAEARVKDIRFFNDRYIL